MASSSVQRTTSSAVTDLAVAEPPAPPDQRADAEEEAGPPTSPTQPMLVTPEQVRPFPKARARKRDAKKCRRQGSTRILIDTPVKQQIENEELIRKEKNKEGRPTKRSLQLKRVRKDDRRPQHISKMKKVRSSVDDTCKKAQLSTVTQEIRSSVRCGAVA